MEKIASIDLSQCIHARNALNEALCSFGGDQVKLTDNLEDITCPQCKIYKQFHRSQPK